MYYCRSLVNESYQVLIALETLPVTDIQILNYIRGHITYGVFLPLYIHLGWCIITGYFAWFAIRERISCAKMIQMMHGINAPLFWLPRYCCDMVILIFLSVICVLLSAIPGFIGYNEPMEIRR